MYTVSRLLEETPVGVLGGPLGLADELGLGSSKGAGGEYLSLMLSTSGWHKQKDGIFATAAAGRSVFSKSGKMIVISQTMMTMMMLTLMMTTRMIKVVSFVFEV